MTSARVTHARAAQQLAERLAELAEQRATLTAELTAFRADHARLVGAVMAEVGVLEARVLALTAARSPRSRASARAAPAPPDSQALVAPEELKRRFRAAAKRLHPDLTDGPAARAHAEAFMKRLNAAYRAGDASAIDDLVEQWDASPYGADSPRPAEDQAPRHVRRLRAAVAREEERLAALRGSELALLMERAMATATSGGDLLAELRVDALARLAALRERLATLEAHRSRADPRLAANP